MNYVRRFWVLPFICSLLIVVLIGCGSNQTSDNVSGPMEQIASSNFAEKAGTPPMPSAGELHNAILDALDKEHNLFDDGKYANNDDFAEDMKTAINEAYQAYNINTTATKGEVLTAIASLDSLVDLGLLTWPELGVTPPQILDHEALFAGMVQQNLINSTDAAWLNGLNDALEALSDPDADDVQTAVVQYGAVNGWPVPTSPLATYLSVLLASNQYWDNAEKRPLHDIGIITYDATGAYIGLFGGPAWSIIIAAAYSCSYAITNPE